jgi:hypothetical protein
VRRTARPGLRDATGTRDSTLGAAPSARARRLINVFIICWLAWQLMVPLSYYLGGDVDDERFAWRMFSGVWLLQKSCSASVTERRSGAAGGPPLLRKVNLERSLHSTWIGQLRRNQRLVVEKFLQTRCDADPSVTGVEYSRTCATASDRLPPVTHRFDCDARTFTGR